MKASPLSRVRTGALLACVGFAVLHAASPAFSRPATRSQPKPAPKAAGQKRAVKAAPQKSPADRPSLMDPELRAAIKNAPKASDYPKENYAMILDIGSVTVKPDGTEIAEYRIAYKFFNKRARDLAEISLPYNKSYQNLEVVQARSISPSGKIMDVKRSDIRTASPYTDYPLYDDSMYVGFSMPGIEDESVIDYTYRVTSKPIFMKGHFSETWAFNGVTPISLSRLTITTPANMPIRHRVYNEARLKPAFTTSSNGTTKTMVWEVKNVKPLETEPYMPPQYEVTTWLDLTTIPTWEEIARWYEGLAKPQAVPNAAMRATVQKLIAGKTNDEEKARALHDWVTHKIRYVGLEFGLSAYKPHAAAEVFEKLYGDCKDKATLLITMMDLAGIPASPVLVSATDGIDLKEWLPSINSFDHCIVRAEVAGKPVWLDPTDETADYGDTPLSARDSSLLVVKDGGSEMTHLPGYSLEENQADARAKITLVAESGAEIETEIRYPAS
ncbi:MAG: DUF3857 domain-containing protein, partial [Armatimonadetes bacterium]|nr:DUF3857 domain-containing protein [Armatimonadota bacterium]